MFKNYLTVALRNFWRNKAFSLINIAGLSIGISASLVIFLIVSYDLSFEKFEKDSDRIYRVTSDFVFSGNNVIHNSGITSPMAPALKKEVAGVDVVAPFRTWGSPTVSVPYPNPAKPVVIKKQEDMIYADENYFKLIPYTWLAGSPATAFKDPYQIVLTETRAKLYFPNIPYSQVVGRQVTFDDSIHTTVSGVVKDIEEHTDFTFKAFVSIITLDKTSLKPGDWEEWGSTTSDQQLLVKLAPGVTAAQFTPKVFGLFKAHKKPDPEDHAKYSFSLQPLRDIHFNENYGTYGNNHLAHKSTLYGLLAVAAFLLLLACINFVNLTTAQASQRAKEIGIRKTMGSNRRQLTIQFLSETFLLTLTATVLSILITPLLLKVFADFIPAGLHFDVANQPDIILFLVILIMVVSLLSGFYPAVLLSSYNPALVLKSQAYTGSGKTRTAWLRKGLTVSQFVIAQVFIIATILVSKQISYTLNKDLGFKKDAIVYFNTKYNDTSEAKRALLVQKLKAIPEVAMVSRSNNPPSGNSIWTSSMKYNDGKKDIETSVHIKKADTNYVKLFQLKMLAGTNITESDTTNSIIINNTYAKLLGFKNPADAIGKRIEWNDHNQPVVGVVADFHQKSLHAKIEPLVIANGNSQARMFNIALVPQNAEGTIWKAGLAKIEKAFKQVYPDDDYEITFFDENIAKFYDAEKNMSRLLMWCTGLTMFISCLGLLGLVIYITNQRTKEIGIRKIVGATVPQIITLLSKDFLKLIVIAFIIALPFAWWGADAWLNNFAYKTSLSWWVFASGGLAMLLVAFIVMLARTLKVAVENPIKSLRTE